MNKRHLAKFNHRVAIREKQNLKNMERIFGKNSDIDDILNLDLWKEAQKNKNNVSETITSKS